MFQLNQIDMFLFPQLQSDSWLSIPNERCQRIDYTSFNPSFLNINDVFYITAYHYFICLPLKVITSFANFLNSIIIPDIFGQKIALGYFFSRQLLLF